MKKTFTLIFIFAIFLSTGRAFARQDQDNEAVWQSLFSDDFTSADLNGWPVGDSTEGPVQINRSIQDGQYTWTLTAPENNFSWLGLDVAYPVDNQRIRVSTSVDLPDFTPYTCAGLLLDGHNSQDGSDFYTYMICNDQTYSLNHYQNGSWNEAIGFTPLSDYDSSGSNSISAELQDGWVDLFFNGETLDTFNIGFQYGSLGLIVQPLTTQSTIVSFGPLTIESSAAQSSGFQAAEISQDVSEDVARVIKMLNMKDRISSSGGEYTAQPDLELSLAEMGNFKKSGLPVSAQNLLLQADIAWESAFDKPDYASSGCGFYLRSQDTYNYLRVYAAMDGAVYLDAFRNGTQISLTSYNYGSWSVKGSGRLSVVADTEKISVLFDDKLLGTYTDATWISSGDAGELVLSGTNLDYGTKCTFTNVQTYAFAGD